VFDDWIVVVVVVVGVVVAVGVMEVVGVGEAVVLVLVGVGEAVVVVPVGVGEAVGIGPNRWQRGACEPGGHRCLPTGISRWTASSRARSDREPELAVPVVSITTNGRNMERMAKAIRGARHLERAGGFPYFGPLCRLRAWLTFADRCAKTPSRVGPVEDLRCRGSRSRSRGQPA
jgi:hypothetical protein